MLNKHLLFCILCFFSLSFLFAQKENDSTSIALDKEPVLIENQLFKKKEIDPLRPSKAAFYSAILPGAGQFYNKKYWKIPIVWGAIGTGVYFYLRNDKQFDRYRDAYKRRLAGFTDDEFYGVVSNDGLIRAQKQFRRNKEISLLVTIGLYALNIIDANVDAHLLQFNVDENLSLSPHYQYNQMENSGDLGLTVNFKF
ncbi:DUF5683 domain-containing protein [Winogradskyella sp.]|uniref:DUF5683 domain-containing protein n=1 Tax=Winogradskyella sp. TaxID=1883156 RepID=UPI0025EB765A|nr:DUF5683 domain-containing protein [Winogradskyella sp.]MCT4630635.1 DUF5683 domain-containing protein [Winogradskyella sp.]